MIGWPLAFGVTLAVEMGALYLLFRKTDSVGRLAAVVFLGNILTHPVVWFVLPRVMVSHGAYILIAESFALVVEVFVILSLIRPEPWYMSIAGSAFANGSSYGVGLILIYAFW
jgi:hypothetical protein